MHGGLSDTRAGSDKSQLRANKNRGHSLIIAQLIRQKVLCLTRGSLGP